MPYEDGMQHKPPMRLPTLRRWQTHPAHDMPYAGLAVVSPVTRNPSNRTPNRRAPCAMSVLLHLHPNTQPWPAHDVV